MGHVLISGILRHKAEEIQCKFVKAYLNSLFLLIFSSSCEKTKLGTIKSLDNYYVIAINQQKNRF